MPKILENKIKKKSKRKLTALGVDIFAGGFTIGVKQAGFDVLAHLEETNYGVATVKANFPDLPIYVGVENWPLDKLYDGPKIDLVYGNPPCAAWSSAGSKLTTSKKRDWKTDPRVAWTHRHFSVLEKLQPRVWVWESVIRAFTAGRELVDELAAKAINLGYSVTYLLHNAQYLGVPQRRKRFFFIAHKTNFDVADLTWKWQTCGDSLSEIADDPGELTKNSQWFSRYSEMIHTVKPGETLVKAWDRWMEGKDCKLTARGFRKGRPAFTIRRLNEDLPSSVVMCAQVHPTINRLLTGREQAHLCGFPADYKFVKLTDVGQISRGVCPPVAKWLATTVRRGLLKNKVIVSPIVKLIDLQKPPGQKKSLCLPADSLSFAADEVLPTITVKNKRPVTNRRAGRLGSGEYIRGLLTAGELTDDEIVIAVHKQFPASRATTKDVRWNAAKLKRDKAVVPTVQATAKKKLPSYVDPDREFDMTSLTENSTPSRVVHRDYGAHFFRWGFAGRFIDQTKTVLDVGCGQDTPLIKILNHPRSIVPKGYVGLDIRKKPIKNPPRRKWAKIYWEFNFVQDHKKLETSDVVICFEVLEHMRKPDGEKLLAGLRKCVKPDGVILLSTPVFNGKAAANHLYEWTVDELQTAVAEAGLRTEQRYGTFASYHPLKKAATAEEMALLDRLRAYYSNEVMACFLAPLYPDASRNNVWILKQAASAKNKFAKKKSVEKKFAKKKKFRRKTR